MKNRFFAVLLVTILLLLPLNVRQALAASATPDWVNTSGGAGSDETRAVAIGESGDSYLGTNFGWGGDATDLDPSEGTDIFDPTGSGAAAVTKYESDGSYGWSSLLQSDSQVTILGIAVDEVNNRVYAGGVFSGTADFDPGVATQNETAEGQNDGFLVVLNLDGEYVDHFIYSSPAPDEPITNVEVDSSGNVVVLGYFYGVNEGSSELNVDPNGEVIYTNSHGENDSDSFVVKYDSDLNYVWSRAVGGEGQNLVTGLDIGIGDTIHIAGRFDGTNIDFDGTSGTDLKTSLGSRDAFVTRYEADGDYVWTQVIASDNYEDALAVASDSSNNIYFVGEFYESDMDFDYSDGVDLHSADENEYGGAYVTKINNDGSYGWTRSWDGIDYDMAPSVTVNENDRVIVASYIYSPSLDLDGTDGETAIEILDGASIGAISMYNANGDFGFGYLLGEGSGDLEIMQVVAWGSDLYVAGEFSDSDVNFGIGDELLRSSAGSADSFLAKYSIDSSMAGDDDNEDEDDGDDEDSGSSSSSRSRSRSSKPKAPTCTAEDPTSAPDLFQIDTENGSATLYFSPASGKVSGYHVSYGFIPGVYLFGTTTETTNNNDGVQTHTINHLMPFLTYNFRVMAVNGCAPGPWSQDLDAKVLRTGKNSSFFYN